VKGDGEVKVVKNVKTAKEEKKAKAEAAAAAVKSDWCIRAKMNM
jgi:hypothetical protein